jgi:two-component sensor histidine kinase
MAATEAPNSQWAAPQSKTSRRRWESADTVLAGSVGLIVLIFAILGFLVWQAYFQVLEEAETRARRAADVVAEQTGWVVGSGLMFLSHKAEEIAAAPDDSALTTAADLEESLSWIPASAEVAFYDAAGAAVSSTGGESLPATLADADYFAELAEGREWTIVPESGENSGFLIVKRLERGGTFAGAAALAIGDGTLESFWSLQDLGEGSTVSIVRDDGWVVARHPPLSEPLSLADLPVFATLKATDTGSYSSGASPADGVSRVVGFRQVPKFGLITLAALSRDQVLNGLWYSTFVVTALILPIALALLAGSILTARLLRRSEATRKNLAAAVAHNELLFREIHHRIKNNLQSVNSLLQLQPIPREVRAEMGQRIAAMSAVHEHIYRSGNFSSVVVRDYLRTLIKNIHTGHGAEVKVVEEIEDLSVDKDVATPLGLIVNEVVSNAFKHAFVDTRQAELKVRLVRNEEGMGVLTVEDNGVGFDPSVPSKGIGQKLINALTQQIGGQYSYRTDAGSRFELVFPLAPND